MNRPNILIFMTDQQRGDSILNDKIPTPNLDQFRKEGLTFTEAHCPSPHCCPSRASFFTGLYPSRHGTWNNVTVSNALSRGVKEHTGFWSTLFKEEGYHLNFSGKWHVDSQIGPEDLGWTTVSKGLGSPPYHPANNDGTDFTPEEMEVEKINYWKRYKSKKADTEYSHAKPGQIIRPGYLPYQHYGIDENPFGDTTTTDRGIDMIKAEADKPLDEKKPWVQYIGLLGPHDPYKVPQQFLDKIDIEDIELPANFSDDLMDKPAFHQRIQKIYSRLSHEEHKEAIRHYYAFCAYIDHQFGRVLEALEQTNQVENTLVIFMSDHGDYCAEHGLWTKGMAPFRGAYHIPLVMRWPKGMEKPGRSSEAMVSLVDFAPTFLDIAHIEKNPHGTVTHSDGNKKQLDFAGMSLVPFFKDQPSQWRKEMFTQSNGNELFAIQRIVWDEKYKFVFNGFDFDELYDLENDPIEVNNLIPYGYINSYRDIVKKYYKKIWQFAYDHGDQYMTSYINTAYAEYGPGVLFE
jgi:arylsulfatase A-like enzyme